MAVNMLITVIAMLAMILLVNSTYNQNYCVCYLANSSTTVCTSPGCSAGTHNCNGITPVFRYAPNSGNPGLGYYGGCNCPGSAYGDIGSGNNGYYSTTNLGYNYIGCGQFGSNVGGVDDAAATACCNYCCPTNNGD